MTFNERYNGGQIQLVFLVADGRGRLRAADRLRQRRQPAAGALGAPVARDGRPRVARRHALAHRPAAAGRERAARAHRRCARLGLAIVGIRLFDAADGGRRQAVLDSVHDGRHASSPSSPRSASAPASSSAWRRRCTSRRPTSTRSSRKAAAAAPAAARPALDRRPDRRGAGAHAGAARRRRLHDAQLPVALRLRPRHRNVAPADDADAAAEPEVSDAGAAPRLLQAPRRAAGGARRRRRRPRSRPTPRWAAGTPRQLRSMAASRAAGEQPPIVTLVTSDRAIFEPSGCSWRAAAAFDDLDGTPGHENAIVNQRFVAMHFAARIRSAGASGCIRRRRAAPGVADHWVTIVGIVAERPAAEPAGVLADPVVYMPDPVAGAGVRDAAAAHRR